MSINLKIPDIRELKPRITVFGVGGAGGNAVNNMIRAGLQGVDFVVANTDAQALTMSEAERIIQMGVQVTEGLGAGSHPDVGRAAADEVLDEIRDHLSGAHMVFVTAGMGGGTGTGASPVIARAARELGILTVGVVTKPFHFEGQRRMRIAEQGIAELQSVVDTLIIIPNQNLFRVANEKTTFADAFAMADQVLYSGVGCITDLMVKEGLINLDFADVRAVMREMGKAMMGTGEATDEKRALRAAEAAIANPLIDDVSMKGARGLLISISGGKDLTLYEVDEAATRIREEVDPDANIIVGATFDESLDGIIRVSVVATGVDQNGVMAQPGGQPPVEAYSRAPEAHNVAAHEARLADLAVRLRAENKRVTERAEQMNYQVPAERGSFAASQPEGGAAVGEESYDSRPEIDAVATAAVAGALVERAIEDVTVRPIPPKPSFFTEAVAEDEEFYEEEPPTPSVFIPPQPERPSGRAPRMPRIDELPIPAQNELRAQRGELPESEPEKRRMTLLQRLAAVGLGRRESEEPKPEPKPTRSFLPEWPAQRMPRTEPRAPEPVSEYARRQSPQGLDMHGRPAPAPRDPDDDQLDIPAFLRRQVN
ncbi:MAG: cell division protein FtsZ [Rhodoplanes sp.]